MKITKHWLPKSIFTIVQYIIIGLMALGASYSTDVGQWFILAFGLYALFIKKDSRFTFAVALFLLITIPLFKIFNQDGISENAAVYAFEVLAIGTLQSILVYERG